MTQPEHVEHSYRLLTTGALGGWLGLVVFLAVGALVCWQLLREFRGPRPGRRSRPGAPAIPHRILPALRLLIVAVFVWLLCRPELIVVKRWRVKPGLLVAVSNASSARVREEFGRLYEKVDALDSLEGTGAKRNRAASRLTLRLAHLLKLLRTQTEAVDKDLAEARSGLPLGPAFARRLDGFRRDLGAQLDQLAAIRADLPAKSAGKELQESLNAVSTQADLLLTSARAVQRVCPLVAREASMHPDVLARFAPKLAALTTSAEALLGRAASLQDALDAALLKAPQLDAYRKRAVTRGALAEKAAQKLTREFGRAFDVTVVRADSTRAAFRAAFLRQLTEPVTGVIYLGDGSRPLQPAGRELLDNLAAVKLPVHTILIGTDGARPSDVGLVSVDVPAIALVNQPVKARALVKNALAGDARARLVVRDGSQTLAEQVVPHAEEPTRAVDVSFTLRRPGRHAIVFQAAGDAEDAYTGNERFVAVLDCLPARPRVLLVSDRLAGDVVAWRQVLAQLPCVQSETILAEPEISTVTTGTKPGEFPPAAGDFKNVALVILCGSVPADLPETALQGLRDAIDKGLHVCVQQAPGLPGRKSWAEALGIAVSPLKSPAQVGLVDGFWPDLAALGPDAADSLARWRALPKAPLTFTTPVPGLTLLEAGGDAVVRLLRRGRGVVLYVGVADLAPLRDGSSAPSVNRLIAGLVQRAFRPLGETLESGAPLTLFPPTPTWDKKLLVSGLGANAAVKGLEPVEPATAEGRVYRVTAKDAIALDANGIEFKRPVQVLLTAADFELTPHAAVLEEIADKTRGRFGRLVEMSEVLAGLKGASAERSSVTKYNLWRGGWSLIVILLAVSAEYLLRRRAGRVM